MEKVRRQVMALAATDADVLLLGETGAGKEVVARALHEEAAAQGQALCRAQLRALPADIIESELFGHEKGAFTGPAASALARWNMPMGARCFSMRSSPCHWSSRSSCCG
ncbi:sigma 54-interacting transcriptional regulator [Pannonibacter sp. Pt2-lr]